MAKKQAQHLAAVKPTPSDIREAEVSMKNAEALRNKCRSTYNRGKTLSMEQCEAVWETESTVVRVNGEFVYCWVLWGYTSWEDFLGKEMDLHLRTAYTLRNVWQLFGVELKGAWDADLLLGPTKMKLLTYAPINRKNANSWLRKAKAMTCKALAAEVFDKDEKHTLQLELTNSQFRQVRGALEIAKSTISNGEKMKHGELIAHIVSAWTSANRGLRRAA